ncbi:MAG: IS4 family transposase [Parachlamydiaceae bacterium]
MNKEWVEKQWQGAELGDKRLAKRAIKIGKACLETPGGSLPEKFGSWGETKGAYRFFDSKAVSHEALQKAHNNNVIQTASTTKQMVLFIQDGSELIYNTHKCTHRLGPTADAFGQGIMFHTALAVEWTRKHDPIVIGVAKQAAWIRPEYSEEKKVKEQEEKESQVWLSMLKDIGRPPPNSRWVSVGDRGNDIYEYVVGAVHAGWNLVVRAKHDRTILVDGENKKLKAWIRSLKCGADYKLDLRSRGDKLSRVAELKVCWGQVLMQSPQDKKGETISVTYIRAYDPEDAELEWILVTTLKVDSAEDALTIVQIYEHRWIIEEYHKCLKTGCRIEDAQLKTGKRLLALLGILGVVATQLLKLRDLSRQQPDRPAKDVIEKEIIEIVKSKFDLEGEVSLKELWRRIAMMGGFLGRKSDGSPGWQTIWKGWLRIQDMLAGMALVKKNCG